MKIKQLLPFLFGISLSADQFSFILYNDFFVGTDKHFTNGASLTWIDDEKHFDKYDLGVSINQMMITPTDLSKKEPQYNDIPYIGYLYISSYMIEVKNDSFFEYRVEAGVVGPDSGAEETQNTFHSIIGSERVEGWDTQLGRYYKCTFSLW